MRAKYPLQHWWLIDRLFVRYAGSFMRTATRRKSASSIELWCTVTPSSPSWPSLKPWATSRSNMRTVAERWVHTAFPPQINHTHPLYSITHTHSDPLKHPPAQMISPSSQSQTSDYQLKLWSCCSKNISAFLFRGNIIIYNILSSSLVINLIYISTRVLQQTSDHT